MSAQVISNCLLGLLLVWTSSWGASFESLEQPDTFVVRGRMNYVNIEGGCWVLEETTGKKYDLIGRHPQLYKQGLRVVALVKKPDRPVYGFCPGEKVELIRVLGAL